MKRGDAKHRRGSRKDREETHQPQRRDKTQRRKGRETGVEEFTRMDTNCARMGGGQWEPLQHYLNHLLLPPIILSTGVRRNMKPFATFTTSLLALALIWGCEPSAAKRSEAEQRDKLFHRFLAE